MKNKKGKTDKSKKFSAIVLIFVSVCLVLYIVQAMYFDKSSIVKTEYALNDTQEDIIYATGFAVRDEFRENGGKNSSVLYKNSDKIYVPIIKDSAPVGLDDNIAVCFDSENQADAYMQIKELEAKKESLLNLKNYENLNKVDVSFLNSRVYKNIQDYVGLISESKYSQLDGNIDNFCSYVTSRQIAVGNSYDFNGLITDCENKIKSLESVVGSKHYITSPYAGYFVSLVDGFEETVSYKDVADKKVSANKGDELLNTSASPAENVYGKIIAQHTWYLIFDISLEEAESIKTGKTVYVDFPERSIDNIPMTVHNVSELKDGKVTVTLKCKYLNEKLAVLRKEKLTITVSEYEGIRISNDALIKNEEGIDGVYVLSGNVARFTPIHIIYYGNDFVLAEKYIAYKTDKKGKKVIDEEKTSSYRSLAVYDSIIVKGTNIVDGKVIY